MMLNQLEWLTQHSCLQKKVKELMFCQEEMFLGNYYRDNSKCVTGCRLLRIEQDMYTYKYSKLHLYFFLLFCEEYLNNICFTNFQFSIDCAKLLCLGTNCKLLEDCFVRTACEGLCLFHSISVAFGVKRKVADALVGLSAWILLWLTFRQWC